MDNFSSNKGQIAALILAGGAGQRVGGQDKGNLGIEYGMDEELQGRDATVISHVATVRIVVLGLRS